MLQIFSNRTNSKQEEIRIPCRPYFVCHIGPNFQISLICAFIGCPQSVVLDFWPTRSNLIIFGPDWLCWNVKKPLRSKPCLVILSHIFWSIGEMRHIYKSLVFFPGSYRSSSKNQASFLHNQLTLQAIIFSVKQSGLYSSFWTVSHKNGQRESLYSKHLP